MGVIALLNIPYIQQKLSAIVAEELSRTLNTEVHIGNLDMGLLNRILLDDVRINDQSGKKLLEAAKLSAKFEILPLFKGKITIHGVQLFGLKVKLEKKNPEATPNYQFILDALASKDTSSVSTPLNLRINSVLIRKGDVRYSVLSNPATPGKFNPSRLHINNLRANISLKALTNDSINATVRQLSFNEQSGFHLRQLALKIVANQHKAVLSRFQLELPKSQIKLDSIVGHYQLHSPNVIKTLIFQGGIDNSYITPCDFACFVPSLSAFQDGLDINAQVLGSMNEIELSKLNISSDNRDVQVSVNGKIRNPFSESVPYLEEASAQIQVTTTGVHFLFKNLIGDDDQIPPILSRLGNIKLKVDAAGPLDNLNTRGLIQTVPGTVESELVLDSRGDRMNYKGSIKVDEFQLGELLGDNKWGKIAFGIDVNGKVNLNKYPECMIKGLVSTLEYKNYAYHNITLDGYSADGGYDGLLTLNDKNGDAFVFGSFNAAKKIPEFNLTVFLKHFRPHDLNLSDKYADTDISINVSANFSGSNLDNMEGTLDLDSLLMIAPQDYYFMENLNVTSHRSEEKRKLTITSDFMNGSIEGEINFATLPESFIRLIHPYIPSLVTYKENKKHKDNNFNFDVTLVNTDLFSKLFYIPVELRSPSALKGYVNEEVKKMRIEGYFPNFNYEGKHYESGMLLCENPSDEIKCHLRVSKKMKQESMINLTVEATAKEDLLKTAVTWGNNTGVTYSGKISAITEFWKAKEQDAFLQAKINIEPSHVILNDTIWNLHQSHIKVDSGCVYVDKFLFEHDDQHLMINGNLTNNPSDSLIVDLNKIKLEYVFDILQFHPVDFKGLASGRAYLSQLFKEPQMEARLSVKDFKFNDGLMGDMRILGRWDKEKGIYLDANIQEPNISQTLVRGYVSPIDDALDLRIQADSSNLEFLNRYTEAIFEHITGRTTGEIHLHGPFDELNLEGDAIVNATARVGILNTQFSLRGDSVKLRYNKILFSNMDIYDPEGHKGLVNGELNHEHLGGDMSYNFRIDTDNLLVYNEKQSNDLSFYGTVYGTGFSTLRGNSETLNVDINLQTDDRTTFVYNAATPEEITSSEFITFVDRTPKREIDTDKYSYKNNKKEEEEEDIPMDIRINFQVDVTPDATIKVIMDPISGDFVTTRGSGSLRANYFNKGDFKMYGTYTLDYGMYKLSLQEVIRKEFQLKQGGTVTFSGDPYEGNLNLQAVYTVNSASLNDLAPGASFTQNSVKVNCLMDLTGRIFSPEIRFDLELPTVSEEEREIVRSYVSTDEQLEMQIIYLLGIGRFYTYDYTNNAENESGQSSSAMSSLLSSTLSGQLNNMLSQVINSNKWNFGTNFSTGNKGWTDMEVEGMLSGRLLNNRLLINGNFGYRDNPMANTNFVGDFDVQWLLTPSGEISLKGYNQTNDRYFTKTTLTTQGIGIIFKKDFDHWMEIFRKKRKSSENQKDSLQSTSIPTKQEAKAKQKREKKSN